MAKHTTKFLIHSAIMALVLVSLMHQAMSILLCNIDTNDLELCRAAVTGKRPPPPTQKCCRVIRGSDLACLCKYKTALPAVGINPANALSLPRKCGLTRVPPQCKA